MSLPKEQDHTKALLELLYHVSREVVEKLNRVRPQTLAQASRISGITPAALSILAIHLRRKPPARAVNQ
jgi:tRNA uridine 5-carboxymethylaminomethyl modification enzyme